MEENGKRLIELLAGDAKTLFRLTFRHNEPIPEADIRAASTILRRWLVDGDIHKLAKALGEPIEIPALNNTSIVRTLQTAQDVEYFLTGGIMMEGNPVMGIYSSPNPDPNDVSIAQLPSMEWTMLRPSKFASQRRLFFEGCWFDTSEIITFVANKLGGNHLSSSRNEKQQMLDRSSRFFLFGGPENADPNCEIYLVIEPSSADVFSGLHIEIIAASASFIQMEIGGVALSNLSYSSSIGNWLRKKLKPASKPKLIEPKG